MDGNRTRNAIYALHRQSLSLEAVVQRYNLKIGGTRFQVPISSGSWPEGLLVVSPFSRIRIRMKVLWHSTQADEQLKLCAEKVRDIARCTMHHESAKTSTKDND